MTIRNPTVRLRIESMPYDIYSQLSLSMLSVQTMNDFSPKKEYDVNPFRIVDEGVLVDVYQYNYTYGEVPRH